MEIYAKSAMVESQIQNKENIGCDGIEIQLLDELVDGHIGSYFNAEEVFSLDSLLKHNIKAVHSPILNKFGMSDINIESLCDDNNFKLLDQVCYIANKAGEIHNRQIIVIIHSETFRGNMELVNSTWNRVVSRIGMILLKYPRVEIAIENLIPIREMSKGILHLANNFFDDNIDMVLELRKQLNTDRVGTVLDTCHAEVSIIFFDAVKKAFPNDISDLDFSMDNYFRLNKDVVKLFHFSHTIGTGCKEGEHGMPFDNDSKQIAKNYLSLYNKYDIKAPITLEVAETDYNISNGFKESKRIIDECLSEMR